MHAFGGIELQVRPFAVELGGQLQRHFKYGRLAEFFVLDTRTFRSTHKVHGMASVGKEEEKAEGSGV